MGKIEDILIDGNQRNASDIHLCPGSPVMFRIDGYLIPMSEEKIKPYEIEEMIKPMLTTEQLEVLERDICMDMEKEWYCKEKSVMIRCPMQMRSGRP